MERDNLNCIPQIFAMTRAQPPLSTHVRIIDIIIILYKPAMARIMARK